MAYLPPGPRTKAKLKRYVVAFPPLNTYSNNYDLLPSEQVQAFLDKHDPGPAYRLVHAMRAELGIRFIWELK